MLWPAKRFNRRPNSRPTDWLTTTSASLRIPANCRPPASGLQHAGHDNSHKHDRRAASKKSQRLLFGSRSSIRRTGVGLNSSSHTDTRTGKEEIPVCAKLRNIRRKGRRRLERTRVQSHYSSTLSGHSPGTNIFVHSFLLLETEVRLNLRRSLARGESKQQSRSINSTLRLQQQQPIDTP